MLLVSGMLTLRLVDEPVTVNPLVLVNVTVEVCPGKVVLFSCTVMFPAAMPDEELAVKDNVLDG
jgi:hypothetical protein